MKQNLANRNHQEYLLSCQFAFSRDCLHMVVMNAKVTYRGDMSKQKYCVHES